MIARNLSSPAVLIDSNAVLPLPWILFVASINSCISTYFNLITNTDRPQLGHFKPFSLFICNAEAVTS